MKTFIAGREYPFTVENEQKILELKQKRQQREINKC